MDSLHAVLDPDTRMGAFLLGFFANLATVIIVYLLFRGKISG